jgi:ribonuclease VapC
MVVDASAIIAILANEPERDDFMRRLARAASPRLSAAATVELTIVLTNKKEEGAVARLDRFLQAQRIVVEPVTAEQARMARYAFRTYGKGRHPAKLNFGDTFSYALAKATGEPLLFKGQDFAQTDVTPAV